MFCLSRALCCPITKSYSQVCTLFAAFVKFSTCTFFSFALSSRPLQGTSNCILHIRNNDSLSSGAPRHFPVSDAFPSAKKFQHLVCHICKGAPASSHIHQFTSNLALGRSKCEIFATKNVTHASAGFQRVYGLHCLISGFLMIANFFLPFGMGAAGKLIPSGNRTWKSHLLVEYHHISSAEVYLYSVLISHIIRNI